MLLQDTVQIRAVENPDATAIVAGSRRIGYGELDRYSNRIARQLLAHGVKAGHRVGLMVPKSIEAIAGILGILKAGAIYVPVDTRSPAARVRKVLAASEPSFILAAGCVDLLTQLGGHAAFGAGWLDRRPPAGVSVAFTLDAVLNEDPDRLPAATSPDQPAHILFTSGSTGVPKGVVITHNNAMSFVKWAHRYFGMSPDDRNSSHPPLHFDLSTFDLYGTFFAGAELHLVPEQANLMAHTLAEFIRGSKLTQWFSVPSALKFMAQFDVLRTYKFPGLRRILWCGESLPTPTLMYWMKHLKHVQFTNLYGPTEATIASSYYTVPECPKDEQEPISIGSPCEGEYLEVLDASLQPVQAGGTGDLYISGVGLSPGYWQDPRKTSEAFVTSLDGRRIYKTGDLARTDATGRFYLLGRSDTQIKSRGYRIELGEIEAALHTLDEIRECAVVAVPNDEFGGTSICCAYVTSAQTGPEPSELREKLTTLLPSYMLPSRWLRLADLPLNGNGKIHRPWIRDQFGAAAAAV